MRHGVDQIQWALGMDGTGPEEMWPISDGPNGQVGMRYPGGVELHFVLEKGPMGGGIFIGEKGKLEINRNKVTSNPPEIATELLKKLDLTRRRAQMGRQDSPCGRLAGTFRIGSTAFAAGNRPVADVEIGHRSISVCHLANITRRLGRRLHWDPAKEHFVGDAEADELVSRPRRKGFELPAAV